REKVDHANQFAVVHQRQTDIASNSVLEEVIVPDKPALSFHIRAYVRFERPLNDTYMMLADVYLGFQRFDVQIRRLPRHDALDGLTRFARHAFDMYGMQSCMLSLEYDDADRIEMNHGAKTR